MTVPEIRVQACNGAPVNGRGEFVLYWMIAHRRTTWNFSLQRAVDWAQQLNRPLIVLEALRCDYPWASDRLHQFVIEGMSDNARRLRAARVLYYPYVEPERGAGRGLLAALGARACVVVTDDYPAFFLPRVVEAAAARLGVRLEKVDSNGLLPMRTADRVFSSAYSFRRFLQKTLPECLMEFPQPDPLQDPRPPTAQGIPDDIAGRWRPATEDALAGELLDRGFSLIDHSVAVAPIHGGSVAAQQALRTFISERLTRYADERNQPESAVSSGLSPYLHFGHISTHEVFAEIARREDWSYERLAPVATGKRTDWWGIDRNAEAFLDQLATWRELGFNMCCQQENYDRYDSLPQWALDTLAKHASDARVYLYQLPDFEEGRTHDALWNAAQMQLVREGRIHNYLRMLWGKKILEWTASPEDAVQIMIHLNNKYALDGRDPNSYGGIFWCLGRYDRPWGPERPIFGTIRYMSSDNTARKVNVKGYTAKYAP
jgi:deoxyribodipyrimidine photo-lyase